MKEVIPSRTDIKNRICSLRGSQVMLDRDLAELYEIPIKALNQAVRRNRERFPDNFMFQLSKEEFHRLELQIVTLNSLRSQNVTLEKNRGKHRKYLPYAFTEQGVAMLSGVLKSQTAVVVSIQIMNAFVGMRRFIAANADLFNRLDNVEIKQLEHDKKFEQIFKLIEDKNLKPEKGIFFEGQIFDAYKFISDLVKSAENSIKLIDNFVDESVLVLLSKRKRGVKTIIYTKLSPPSILDLKNFNSQYESIEIREFTKSHDRFMIIDDKEVYHIGASLKDLGKKWFAFSRFDKEALQILERL